MAVKDDLSVFERELILRALDTQIGVFQRKMKAEHNPDIARLVEKELNATRDLSAKFRFSEGK